MTVKVIIRDLKVAHGEAGRVVEVIFKGGCWGHFYVAPTRAKTETLDDVI